MMVMGVSVVLWSHGVLERDGCIVCESMIG